jgi:hypothetical protein
MVWAMGDAAADVWAVELDAARGQAQAALAVLADVTLMARAIGADTAWVSPAMTAFQGLHQDWLADLAAHEQTVRSIAGAIDDARAGGVVRGWWGGA